jgi:hypothetical protein
MREQLVANAAILKRLAEIDKTLLEQDSALRTIWTKLRPLLAPPTRPRPLRASQGRFAATVIEYRVLASMPPPQ